MKKQLKSRLISRRKWNVRQEKLFMYFNLKIERRDL